MSERTASIRDVADLAGVAVSSVSRVLAEHPDVSAAMRARVLAAVAETGYRPNSLAQGLRSGRSMSIGLVVGDISNPLLAEISLAAERCLSPSGYTVLIANSQGDASREVANIGMFHQRQVDGLLLSTSNEDNPALRDAVASFPQPVVLLDREIAGLDVPSTRFDHARGFSQAVRHLAALGHRHLALIAGTEDIRPTRERVQAVVDTCHELGLPDPRVRTGSFQRSEGSAAVHELFRDGERPSALICGGNQLLAGVIEAIRTLGLTVPGDLSLVTTDHSDVARLHSPAISAVVRDAAAFGTAAADLLLSQIGGQESGTVELPTDFSPAASCAEPPRPSNGTPRPPRRKPVT